LIVQSPGHESGVDMQQANRKKSTREPRSGPCGLSLVEMLVALAITAMLLTATMVAIDASFQAYASAVESASTQTATRMVVNRLLTLIRTSTNHAPTTLAEAQAVDVNATKTGDTIECNFLDLLDAQGQLLRLEYRDNDDKLWLRVDDNGNFSFENGETEQPLIGGVTAMTFYAHIRFDTDGVRVLERGSIDMTVVPDEDNTLAIETGNTPPIRVVASTMPRKLD